MTADSHRQTLRKQLAGVGEIFRSRVFWLFAPQAVFVVGGFMALQSLWAVPFLTDAEGFSRSAAAQRVLISALGMLAGFAAVALTSSQLLARGVRLESVLGGSYVLCALALLAITFGVDPAGSAWCVLGACYGVANLAYALLQKHFDLSLAGRVNTALNLMSFCGAFLVQWVFGLALDALMQSGIASVVSYRLAMGALVLLQLAGSLRYLLGMKFLVGATRSSAP